jgi:hypothetical protein
MSGGAAIIIATEEEEAESQALRAVVLAAGANNYDRPLDADLGAMAVKLDEVRAELCALRMRCEAAQ